MTPPALAVVVCTLDRADHVARLLPAVLREVGQDAEIVIVDQSGPGQRELVAAAVAAAADPRLRLIRRERRSLPAARNTALEVTRAPIVLFLDDDVVPRPGALLAHLPPYDDPTVGGVVGRIVERRLKPNSRTLRNEVGRDGRIRVQLDVDGDGEVASLKGANLSVRRSAVAAVGGFDEGYGGTALLEDTDLSERLRAAGWRLRYAASAAVDHLHAPRGGVRVGSAAETERWRFENTARFLRLRRGRRAWLRATPTFVALAVLQAVRWRSPGRIAPLWAAWVRGARGATRRG